MATSSVDEDAVLRQGDRKYAISSQVSVRLDHQVQVGGGALSAALSRRSLGYHRIHSGRPQSAQGVAARLTDNSRRGGIVGGYFHSA